MPRGGQRFSYLGLVDRDDPGRGAAAVIAGSSWASTVVAECEWPHSLRWLLHRAVVPAPTPMRGLSIDKTLGCRRMCRLVAIRSGARPSVGAVSSDLGRCCGHWCRTVRPPCTHVVDKAYVLTTFWVTIATKSVLALAWIIRRRGPRRLRRIVVALTR